MKRNRNTLSCQTSKKWITFDLTGTPESNSVQKQKEASPQVEENSNQASNSLNLIEKIQPKNTTDLAVHPKKIKEVEFWLQQNVLNSTNKEHASLLLLTGPTGSGKSAALDVICRTLNISISEWLTPLDKNTDYYGGSGQTSRFCEFFIESKYPTLFDDCSTKLLLVQDFPNSVIRSPEEFFGILEKCFYIRHLKVVFICTDANNSKLNLAQTLFPETIREKFKIDHISFNPCAPTIMKNVLKRGIAEIKTHQEIYKLPTNETLDAIICSSAGDIRCAINQLYFACLKGTAALPTSKLEGNTTNPKRKRISKSSAIKNMLKDETLGLFHSLGRVLNPKRIEIGDTWRLNCDLQPLIDEFSTQPMMFSAFLFENYLNYFGDLDDVRRAAEYLSVSQVFLENWNDRHDTLVFALWVSVLGVMVFNEHRVSKWNQIRGPVKVNKWVNNSDSRHLSPMDYTYYNIIQKKDLPVFKIK